MTIGSKIYQARKNKGFSQEELASQAGISLRTLQRIEKFASQPHGHTLKSICAVLDLKVENLMDYGKFESRQDLVFLHLGVLAEFFIPMGSIILPLVLWLNKKNQIVLADEHGKNILNFQILYVIVSNVILFAGVYGKLMHYEYFSYFFWTYGLMYLGSKIYAIRAAVGVNKNPERLFYPNWIRFVR